MSRFRVALLSLIALVGLSLLLMPKIPWLGKLPGDIYIRKEHFSFYFPLMTCLVISVVLTLLSHFFRK